jgi:hypothetical protein
VIDFQAGDPVPLEHKALEVWCRVDQVAGSMLALRPIDAEDSPVRSVGILRVLEVRQGPK